MKAPKRASRRERYTSAAFRPYALAIGQAALAWNDLHERLSLLFEQVLDMPLNNAAHKIWHSSIQDRASRNMLKAALDDIDYRWPRGFPKAHEDIEWVLGKTESLEHERNDIIHVPLIFLGHKPKPGQEPHPLYSPRVEAQWFLGNKRALNLSGKDVLATARRVRDTAVMPRDFVVDVTHALGQRSAPVPWPKRPSLPNRGQKKARRDPPRRSRTARHPRPPRPFPA
jgi:hypothetical protein